MDFIEEKGLRKYSASMSDILQGVQCPVRLEDVPAGVTVERISWALDTDDSISSATIHYIK